MCRALRRGRGGGEEEGEGRKGNGGDLLEKSSKTGVFLWDFFAVLAQLSVEVLVR